MKIDFISAAWRFAVFLVVSMFGAFALVAVFAQLRFDAATTYMAEFTNVTGLESGNFVRIAGVEVGKVKDITIKPDAAAVVEFSADDTVILTEGTKAVIRYENLVGGRYLALEEGAGGIHRLAAGQTIPVDRTFPALDLDALIGGFQPLFRALDPEQVNTLSAQLIQVLQGQGESIGSFLARTAVLTNTLADRDQVIGDLITNLRTVSASLADQTTQFGTALDALSGLTATLSERRADVSRSVADTNSAAVAITDLLAGVRAPLQKMITETDRTAGVVVADHEYFDDFLNTLPDAYRVLARQGLYGDFFSFYMCDAVLKLNGKGGNPVFVKIAGQPSGRCAPR